MNMNRDKIESDLITQANMTITIHPCTIHSCTHTSNTYGVVFEAMMR